MTCALYNPFHDGCGRGRTTLDEDRPRELHFSFFSPTGLFGGLFQGASLFLVSGRRRWGLTSMQRSCSSVSLSSPPRKSSESGQNGIKKLACQEGRTSGWFFL